MDSKAFYHFCLSAEKVAGGGALTRYTSHRLAAIGHFILFTACALLLGGCSLAVVKESDIFFLKYDVDCLHEEVQQLKRDVRDLSRGYKVVPIKVTITNLTDNAQQEGL